MFGIRRNFLTNPEGKFLLSNIFSFSVRMFIFVFCWKLLNWGQIEVSTWLKFGDLDDGRRERFCDFHVHRHRHRKLVILSN